MGILSGLEPAGVFRYFEEICSIPHGSGNTKPISDYCVDFATAHGLRYIQDAANNVIIFKGGSVGYETAPTVILQGHLDMVCEKEKDCDIDFERDGLRLRLENGIVSADGTTLGGDDGIAVAYALALLDDDSIPHPPLEVVLTTDEEVGMLGASAMDFSPLQGRIMLNLDSEEEGYLLVGCAGGVRTDCRLPIRRRSADGLHAVLSVDGLRGGHSGGEIDKGRANADLLLGRFLWELEHTLPYELIAVSGGLKDNAIPRAAEAELLIGSDKADALCAFVDARQSVYAAELRAVDPGVRLTLSVGDVVCAQVMDEDSRRRTLAALLTLPRGIQRMSADIEGLVQTSLNLGILTTSEKEVHLDYAVRSSVGTEKEELVGRIECVMELLGGTVSRSGDYPAWEYAPVSPLRDVMITVFEELYGKKPEIMAMHGGVECGLFSGQLPGLDCVSFGPDMQDIHTPQESLSVASVARTWSYLLAVLARLK